MILELLWTLPNAPECAPESAISVSTSGAGPFVHDVVVTIRGLPSAPSSFRIDCNSVTMSKNTL